MYHSFMNKKKPSAQKKPDVTKKVPSSTGERVSPNAIKAVTASSLARPATGKRGAAAGFVRVVMNPVVKPKHFSVAAIRNAVQQVVASR